MISGKEFREWTLENEIQDDDRLDILGGNTVYLYRGNKMVDILRVSEFSIKAFRDEILKEKFSGEEKKKMRATDTMREIMQTGNMKIEFKKAG